jgi:hypothetical protein
MRLFVGDPSDPESPQEWRETPHQVAVTTYLVETDPQYPWGAQVFEFPPEAVEKEADHLLDFARSQIILPGAYIVKEQKELTLEGLTALDVTGEQTGGQSRIEARLIQRGNVVFAAFFEGASNSFSQEDAKKVTESLKVIDPTRTTAP